MTMKPHNRIITCTHLNCEMEKTCPVSIELETLRAQFGKKSERRINRLDLPLSLEFIPKTTSNLSGQKFAGMKMSLSRMNYAIND